MIQIKEYPANKDFFIRLKFFCREILDLCNQLRVTPIAYGSLAYFGYTKNKTIRVNDFDFLIPEIHFEKIIKVLAKNKIKYNYSAEWHTLQIFNDDLRIELDSIDYWYSGPRDFRDFDFDGLIVKAISLEGLKLQYKKASEASKDRPDEYRKKFSVLEKLKQVS